MAPGPISSRTPRSTPTRRYVSTSRATLTRRECRGGDRDVRGPVRPAWIRALGGGGSRGGAVHRLRRARSRDLRRALHARGRSRMAPRARALGQGYASEGARAALRFGFDTIGLDEIVSFTTTRQRALVVGDGAHRDDTRSGRSTSSTRASPVGHPLRPHVLYRVSRTTSDALFVVAQSAGSAAPAGRRRRSSSWKRDLDDELGLDPVRAGSFGVVVERARVARERRELRFEHAARASRRARTRRGPRSAACRRRRSTRRAASRAGRRGARRRGASRRRRTPGRGAVFTLRHASERRPGW